MSQTPQDAAPPGPPWWNKDERAVTRAQQGDRDIASEAVADAYAQALRRGGALRDPAAWIWRAAFRIAARSLKDRRTRDTRLPDAPQHADDYEDLDLRAALG